VQQHRKPDEMSLREFLCVPYLVEAETIEQEAGRSLHRAAHPELPGCMAEASTIVETIAKLERRRVETIVEMLRSATLPPVPRPPLPDGDAQGLLDRTGLAASLTGLLDHTASTFRASEDKQAKEG